VKQQFLLLYPGSVVSLSIYFTSIVSVPFSRVFIVSRKYLPLYQYQLCIHYAYHTHIIKLLQRSSMTQFFKHSIVLYCSRNIYPSIVLSLYIHGYLLYIILVINERKNNNVTTKIKHLRQHQHRHLHNTILTLPPTTTTIFTTSQITTQTTTSQPTTPYTTFSSTPQQRKENHQPIQHHAPQLTQTNLSNKHITSQELHTVLNGLPSFGCTVRRSCSSRRASLRSPPQLVALCWKILAPVKQGIKL
jgi:hypothetical protein